MNQVEVKEESKIVVLHKNIYQRINQVMSEVESVQKESKKVNNQYTFVSHDAVAAALHKPMVRAGIAMIPTIASLEQDGNRTVAKMDISFVNIDNPDDKVTVNYVGYGIDQSDKGIGKAVSYAVKYALLKVFCLETGDDVEKDNTEYKPKKAPKLTKDQVIAIETLLAGDTDRLSKILETYEVEKLDDLSQEHYDFIIRRLSIKKG